MLVRSTLACLAVVLWLPLHAAHAVQTGLTNDFSDGLQDWSAGRATPMDVADGGPDGPGDKFLRLESTGTGSIGSRMTAFSMSPALTGDYLSAGVIAIRMDLNNLGSEPLELRIQLSAFGLAVVSNAFSLPAQGGWTSAVFDVSELGVTAIDGADPAQVLSSVGQLRIMHSPDAVINTRTPRIESVLGLDNITVVVPEPSTGLLLLGGLTLLGARRRAV